MPPAQDFRGLGDDREDRMRELADKCHSDDWDACVTLLAEAGEGYEDFREYAQMCGGYEDADERPEGCMTALRESRDVATAPPSTEPPQPAAPDTDVEPEEPPDDDVAAPAPPTLAELSAFERSTLLQTFRDWIRENPEALNVRVVGELKIDKTARWVIELENDVSAPKPSSVGDSGQFRLDIRVGYADDPDDFSVPPSESGQQLTAYVENGVLRIQRGEIGQLIVTPAVDGSREVAVQLTFTDSDGAKEQVTVALPEQDVSGVGTPTEIWRWILFVGGGVLVAVGAITAVVVLILKLRELFGNRTAA